jgi:hypothetical protein
MLSTWSDEQRYLAKVTSETGNDANGSESLFADGYVNIVALTPVLYLVQMVIIL